MTRFLYNQSFIHDQMARTEFYNCLLLSHYSSNLISQHSTLMGNGDFQETQPQIKQTEYTEKNMWTKCTTLQLSFYDRSQAASKVIV